MILETRARYFGGSDSIQVAILLQEDDFTSAAAKLTTGTAEILHGDTAMFTEQFTSADRVLWFDGDTNYDVPEDRGQFYVFVHHPPAQQNMSARVTVLLSDGRTSTQKVPIDAQPVEEDWQNPALGGRDPIEFPKDPDFPYPGSGVDTMALTPVKVKWSQQLGSLTNTEFVVETTALVNTFAIYQPVLMFHNIGDESAALEIKYTMDLGSGTDDPLNSGTYENTVVDVTVPAGGRYPYDFDSMQLDNDSTVSITHTVTITNLGAATHVFHTILTGMTEVQTQFASANSVIR